MSSDKVIKVNMESCLEDKPKVTFYTPDSKINAIQEDLDELRVDLIFNLDKLLHRGEQLDKLQESTDKLMVTSKQFSQKAQAVHRRFWWEKYKSTILIGSGVSGAVLTVLSFFM